jgi:hypothetical protein
VRIADGDRESGAHDPGDAKDDRQIPYGWTHAWRDY